MGKRIVTEADIYQAVESGKTSLPFLPGECIITPQAMDKAEELGVSFTQTSPEPATCSMAATAPAAATASEAPAAPAVAAGAMSAAAQSRDGGEAEMVVQQVCALLKDRLPAGTAPEVLENIVRNVVVAKLSESADAAPATEAAQPEASITEVAGKDGVCFIEGQRLLKQGADNVTVDEQVFIADAIGNAEGAALAGGYMQWERASFSRTVEAPEIGIVVDGELHVTIGGETMVGKPGDMVYFPKGVNVLYSTPTSVRIACVNTLQ